MESCPTCGARDRGGEACPRCGTELGEVLAVEAEGARWVASARAALRSGEGATAWARAARAHAVHRTPEALRVLALAALATGRYREASRVWRELTGFRRDNCQVVTPLPPPVSSA